jgi:hypothetical protein
MTSTIASTRRRWLSPTLFAVAALAFLLPFATVSCDGKSTTFTGAQLVTHTVPKGGVLDEPGDCSTYIGTCVENASSGTAAVALLAALLGLAIGVIGVARGPGWCAAVGLGALLVMPFEGGLVGPDVNLRSGYVSAFCSLLVACLLHGWRAWARRRRPRRPLETTAVAAHSRAG